MMANRGIVARRLVGERERGGARTLLVAAIALGAGAAMGSGAWWWRARSPAHPAPPPVQTREANSEASLDLEQLKQDSALMRTQLAGLTRIVHEGAGQSPQTASNRPAQIQSEPHGTAPAQDGKAHERAYRDYIDGQFAQESIDPHWHAVAELSPKLADVLPAGSAVREIQCRTSMCRVTTSHPDMDSYRAFLKAGLEFMGAKNLWSGPATTMVLDQPVNGRGEVVALLYLGRGESLPMMPDDAPGAGAAP
jgi:hypothetical protein